MGESIRIADIKPEAKNQCSASQIRKTGYSQSRNSPVERILFLQRTIGNQAVSRLIGSGALQAKLRIGQPGDIYEAEADRAAEQVMKMHEPVQRKCPECDDEVRRQPAKEEEKEEALQAKEISGSTPEVAPELESRINALRGGGQPLPESTRTFYEPRFRYDFSQVRVHTDAKAADLAKEVNARAFTVGMDVVFGAGEYAPGTGEGIKLLTHELTHVVQQQGIIHSSHMQDQHGITKPEDPREHNANYTSDQKMFIEGRISGVFTPTQVSVQRACGRKEIGDVADCAGMSGDVPGPPFLFEKNCDIFKSGEEDALKKFVLENLSSDDIIEIHGFASMDGPRDFNLNLSCARAHKARSVLIGAGISPSQIRPLVMHGATKGDTEKRRSVVIVADKKPKAPPLCTFNHSVAAAYARKWATSTNPTYGRFPNDCTNFVSQAMLAGGWCMIFGSDMCKERKNDNVWWFKRDACKRWLLPDIHSSHTWAGAQNFANFISASGRGSIAKSEMDLEEGDVLQMRFAGSSEIHHSMVVTGKRASDLLLSYHTNDTLNESLSKIKSRNPGAVYIPWKIS